MGKIRKQVYDLNTDDLTKFSVWEFASDEESEPEQDEATVKPVELSGVLNEAGGMFIVRAKYTFADGSFATGYITPRAYKGQRSLGSIQPAILMPDGQVNFWHGAFKPDAESLSKSYRLLGKTARDVFPLRFRSDVALKNGAISGEVSGFLYLKGFDAKEPEIVL